MKSNYGSCPDKGLYRAPAKGFTLFTHFVLISSSASVPRLDPMSRGFSRRDGEQETYC